MPGKRLSRIFSDIDFKFLGCGNPVSSRDDDGDRYTKRVNAPVKRMPSINQQQEQQQVEEPKQQQQQQQQQQQRQQQQQQQPPQPQPQQPQQQQQQQQLITTTTTTTTESTSRPLSRHGLVFAFGGIKSSTSELSLLEDIMSELRVVNPCNTILNTLPSSASMPQLSHTSKRTLSIVNS